MPDNAMKQARKRSAAMDATFPFVFSVPEWRLPIVAKPIARWPSITNLAMS